MKSSWPKFLLGSVLKHQECVNNWWRGFPDVCLFFFVPKDFQQVLKICYLDRKAPFVVSVKSLLSKMNNWNKKHENQEDCFIRNIFGIEK